MILLITGQEQEAGDAEEVFTDDGYLSGSFCC
jgi:hypothetical protein